jgi:type IV pilus biogenesis protein CpaD/CtpE
MKRILFMLIAFVVLAGLVGCTTESRSVTMHKPAVYKGTKDPLLTLKNQQELIDRLKLTQSDR